MFLFSIDVNKENTVINRNSHEDMKEMSEKLKKGTFSESINEFIG